MGKIGSYDYPETQLGTLVNSMEVLVKKFYGTANDAKTFAEALGHNSNKSGAFLTKLADLRKYCLIEKRDISATVKGKHIIEYLTPEERMQELNKTVMEITLWKDLYQRLGSKRPSLDDFKIHLVEISQDRDTAITDAEKIRNLFIDAMAFYSDDVVKEVNNIGKPSEKVIAERQDEEENVGENIPEHLICLRSGETNMTVVRNDANIDILISFLKAMKKTDITSNTESGKN